MAKAPIGKRILAYIIDAVILMAIIFVPLIGMMVLGMVVAMAVPRIAGIIGLITLPVWLLSMAAMLGYALLKDGLNGGKSFGKKFMGLKVVKDGKPCGYVDSALRNVILIIPLVGLIDIIMAFIDAEGLRLGDKVAKTKVVEA
jgi:uncharacterized RDD family membrane protein YckC